MNVTEEILNKVKVEIEEYGLTHDYMREIESKVNIRKSGNGYLIEITDGLTNPVYAITLDELRQIVLYGQAIIK